VSLIHKNYSVRWQPMRRVAKNVRKLAVNCCYTQNSITFSLRSSHGVGKRTYCARNILRESKPALKISCFV